MEELLTAGEACRVLKVSKSTLYRLIREEGLPTIRPGKDRRFSPSDLQKWLETRRLVVPG